VPGHDRLYIGQEAAGAAVLEALGPDDLLLTTHRNHGHLVGRGSDPARVIAEIMGREGGLNRGRGGTLHATDRALGFLQTSALVGGVLPLATGAGFALKQTRRSPATNAVAVAFFGDGALEEGAAFEALNIAALWKLPVVFVCENNSAGAIGQAGGGYPSSVHAARPLAAIPESLGIATQALADGSDIASVHRAACEAVAACRAGNGPAFIEAATERWPGNQGLWPEPATGTTDLRIASGEAAASGPHRDWILRHDPVLRVARELIADGIGPGALAAFDADIAAELDVAERTALASKLPDPAGAAAFTFA